MVRICNTDFLLLTAVMMTAMVTGMESIKTESDEGDARYIFINTASPMTIGLLLNVPLSLALPTVARHDHYHSSYEGRRLPPPFSDSNTAHHYSTSEDDNVLYDDPHYLAETTKLASYFAYLQVREAPCQERFLCELASDPPAFFPASDILLRELRPQHGDVEEDEDNRFWRYVKAAREGVREGNPAGCGARHPACPVAVGEVLNMAALRLWQLLAHILNITFTDH